MKYDSFDDKYFPKGWYFLGYSVICCRRITPRFFIAKGLESLQQFFKNATIKIQTGWFGNDSVSFLISF
jgi:hypothetical protein